MLSGLQIHIEALNEIIPDSFIFVLDNNDRSFIYKSQECKSSMEEIVLLEKSKGLENLLENSDYYISENEEHAYVIKRIGTQMYMGFFAQKGSFPESSILSAQSYFMN